MIDVSKTWSPAAKNKELPVIELPKEDLSELAIELIERIDKEFDHYLQKPDDDVLVATFLHPVGCHFGHYWIQNIANSEADVTAFEDGKELVKKILFDTLENKYKTDSIVVKEEEKNGRS